MDTTTTTPAPVTTAAPADRTVSARARRRAAVVQVYADGFRDLPLREKTLVWHLAPGGARRPRHLLRPALRAQPRDARRARGDRHARRPASIAADARRDRALHEAVLDQHRPLQQPHGAQVRARRARPTAFAAAAHAAAARRRALSAARPARRSTRCSRGCSRCSSTPTSIRPSPARRRAPARTSSPRAPTICTSA